MKVYVVTETIYDNNNAADNMLGVYNDKDKALKCTKLLIEALGMAPYEQKNGVSRVMFLTQKNIFTVTEMDVY